MRTLDRKLFRDLWRLKWQVAAIALLVACGVSVAVMATSAQQALVLAQRAYYDDTRFGDVFATVTRAPRSAARELAAIEGVRGVDTRAVKAGLMEVPGSTRPATARLLALPDDDATALNRLVLMAGRFPDPTTPNEAVALKTFLDAAGIPLGDAVWMIIDGRRITFRIVGAVLSPEFVYVPGPGSMLPDEAHTGVFWAPRAAAERATGLGGAFSTVSLKLAAGASTPAILAAVDRTLAPYGGQPAYARADQVSHKFQADRIERFGIIAVVLPPVFLAVAAALVHIVLGRMVEVEREQIGLLKAFGYGDLQAAAVYLKMAAIIAVLGIVGGAAFGGWIGGLLVNYLAEFMRFPHLTPQFSWQALASAAIFSFAAALSGSFLAARRAAALSPAVAMQPLTPAVFRRGVLERFAVWRALDEPTRMIVRSLERFPVRAIVTAGGFAVSVSLLVGSQFMYGSLDEIVDQAYYRARRWTDQVALADNRDIHALAEIARLPGVLAAEPVRYAPVQIAAHGRMERAALNGLDAGAELARPLDLLGRPLPFIGRGLILSDALADRLGVASGEWVVLSVTEGRRPLVVLPVTAISRDYAGRTAFMARRELNRLMSDGDLLSGANLIVAADRHPAFYQAIEATPEIVGASARADTIAQWRTTVAQSLTIESVFFLGFAAAIAFGIAYNMSRVALADRARDLATLRVLGFRERECAYILFGELFVLALGAAPLGLLGGVGLAHAMVAAFAEQDLKLPVVFRPSGYGTSLAVYLGALLLATAPVARRVWTLDLVGVLKTRE